ncbi:phosphate acetyltransferase [Niabella ginsengisoli]|uniref:Phosphate acetyltransferase n=1 Tax=Niabella ginsengisoli TaxID=522298 RepID=A0ABS9SI37_9BACT|nr:phosphate acetyltransferase [Niabella ginsengisoli]MCH5597829.1 phosphate acetyltransferase [Niabella ginsengisoli]
MNRSVYVITPTAQSGKLLISLGLMQMLQRTTTKVAYFKPLIETNDTKDNHIDTILTHFKINMEYDDAYAFTRAELSEMENQGKINEVYETIINKYKKLEEQFDFVLVEGSDFQEEGSVFEADFNASVAQSLAMPVLLVIKDGFATVANLVHNVVAEVHSFLAKDLNIIGLFVSRCTKDVDEVKQKIDKHLRNEMVVSVIPNDEELTKPSMQEIADHLKAHILFGADKLENVAKTSIIGGMQLGNYLPRMQNDCVCVIPGDRGDLIVGSMLANISPKYPNVAGIVLSGGFLPERSIVNLMDDTQKPLPILAVPTGTFETANKVANIKPRISPANQYKIKLCIDLFEAAVDAEALSQKINSVKTESITPRMFQYNMLVTAKKMQRHIVLPEGTDDRILTAASHLAKDKIVFLTLLGNPELIKTKVTQLGLYWDDERIKIIDPENSDKYENYYQTLYELRKSKGLELAAAADLMLDVSYFGTMMVFKGEADGMVSGAVNTTAHTIKPALQFVKTKLGFNTVSSIFFMLLHDRVLVYGDCAIVPNPTAEQLAEIAISSADSAKAFGIATPKVAMLSYSSGASGSGAEVEKVRAATKIVKETRPDLLVEGPIQYDAAVDPVVGKSKLPNSLVAGQANVLIFPDLNTGNNTYKAVQRETGALAVGPMLQGLNKPINDLSRGATIEDIYNTVVITAIQSGNG